MVSIVLSSYWSKFIGPMVAFAAIFYFGFFGVWGDRGLLKWIALKQDLTYINNALATSDAERDRLAHRVALLRHSIDLDMLDERARAILNYVEPGEIVIFTDKIVD